MPDTHLDIQRIMAALGENARTAARELANAGSAAKAEALEAAADSLLRNTDQIISANARDLDYGRSKSLSHAMIDRLALDEGRIQDMADSTRRIAGLPDPVGEVMAEWSVPSGLRIRRVRTPLGVIGVIYESRPNVTADAGALCLKSGNAVILRCGSECIHSAKAIRECMAEGLQAAGLPGSAIQLVTTRDRAAVGAMLSMTESIDVIVPRGGKGLVARVQEEARVPVFAHLEGICHVYVDRSADPEKTMRVVLNSKTRRTGICGAAECLLIDTEYFAVAGAPFVRELLDAGVEVRGDETLSGAFADVKPASDDDWGCEFLDMVIAARVVDGVDGAIEHIRRYGSGHTDCIVTEDEKTAETFFSRLDSAILMKNASTQFADGGEFGLGAENRNCYRKTACSWPGGRGTIDQFQVPCGRERDNSPLNSAACLHPTVGRQRR